MLVVFDSKDPHEATVLLCHACGVHDHATVKDITENVSRKMCALVCAKLVAMVVSRFCAIPKDYIRALLHQHAVSRMRKRVVPRFVLITLPHINAATTFLRVFTYIMALNTVCGCPLGDVFFYDFFDGEAFHHLCNLYDGRNSTVLVEDLCIGCMRSYKLNEKWCTRFLKNGFVLPRVPEVVCVPELSDLKSKSEPEPAEDEETADLTTETLLQAIEDLKLDDSDHDESSDGDD